MGSKGIMNSRQAWLHSESQAVYLDVENPSHNEAKQEKHISFTHHFHRNKLNLEMNSRHA